MASQFIMKSWWCSEIWPEIHKEGWFWDVISLIDFIVLHPGWVFGHMLHGVLPNGRGSGISGMQISVHLLRPPPPQYVSHQLMKDALEMTYSA